MLETKTGVFFIAGLGFFAVAFLSNAVLPIMMYRHLPEQSVERLLERNGNLRFQFEDLARRFPDSFTAAYGRPPQEPAAREKWLGESCAKALRYGRKIYVGEVNSIFHILKPGPKKCEESASESKTTCS